jgi:hypothetical protein
MYNEMYSTFQFPFGVFLYVFNEKNCEANSDHPPPPKRRGDVQTAEVKDFAFSETLGKYADIFLFYFAGHEPIIIL